MTELTCIVCPKGCRLNVDEENGFLVTGYGCPRGKEYGHKELTAPTRTLTSIVRIEGAIHPCCPVKTSGEIPKRLIIQAMNLLKKVRLSAPGPPERWWFRISAERVWTGLPQRICRQSRRSTAQRPRNQTVPGPLLC